MERYQAASQRFTKIKQKFLNDSQEYLIQEQVIRLMHQDVTTRQKQLIKLSTSDPRTISKYFQTFKPFEFNPTNFKDINLFGGPKMAFNNGKVYIGTIIEGKRHGKGLIACAKGKIYEGQLLNNMRNGLGVQIYQNSNFYVGNFQDNKRSGKGKMIWSPKEQQSKLSHYQFYNGFWKDGEPYGFGLHYAQNVFYLGQFKNGVKHGKGIQYFSNGAYEGSFAFGKKQGKGFLYDQKNQCYEGDFQKGIIHGYGKWLSLHSFQEYEGFFQNGKKQGIGIIQRQKQYYYKGMFTDDKPNGTGQYIKTNEINNNQDKQKRTLINNQTIKSKGQLKSAQFVRANSLKEIKPKLSTSIATEKNDAMHRLIDRKKLFSASSLKNQLNPMNPEHHDQKKCGYRRCSCNNWQKKNSTKTGIDENRIKRIFSSRKVLLKQLG